MADVLIYDEATNRIRDYLPSVHTPGYEGRSDVLVNPDLSAVDGVPRDHWLVDAGDVREMTQAEKDDLAAEREAAAQAAENQAHEEWLSDPRTQALASVVAEAGNENQQAVLGRLRAMLVSQNE